MQTDNLGSISYDEINGASVNLCTILFLGCGVLGIYLNYQRITDNGKRCVIFVLVCVNFEEKSSLCGN